MNEQGKAGVESLATAKRGGGRAEQVGAGTVYRVECRDKHGNLKWVDEFPNLVVTLGRNKLIDDTFRSSGYTSAWYVGLTSGTPTPNAADTMSSHGGWTEVTAYDESVRQTLTLSAASAGSSSNAGSPCVFTISSDGTTIGGVFIATDSTKGGTSGTLYSVGAFTAADKSLDDGDTLTVTATVSVTAS